MPKKNSYLTCTDQFCGAGGSSIGATRAGAEIKLAMNHWKLAIETHNSNFPNVDHVCTDISATDPRRYPSTNILITSPECFPAGSLVLTKTGFKPIEEVKIGDRVLTHLNRWRPVVRTQKSIGDTVIIRGQGHTVGIEVTPNHRFYVRTQSQEWDNRKRDYNRRIYGDPEWLAAEDLARGTYRWCTPIKVIAEAWPMPVGFGENEEIAWWLVGRWLGDGSLGGDGEVVISCGYHKAADLESQMNVTGGNWRAYRKRTAMNFVLYDREQGKWLSQYFGRGAEHKHLPGWILEMPKSLREALLEGYLSADGHRGNRRTRADTVSKALALGMRMLAESLGYRAGIQLRTL